MIACCQHSTGLPPAPGCSRPYTNGDPSSLTDAASSSYDKATERGGAPHIEDRFLCYWQLLKPRTIHRRQIGGLVRAHARNYARGRSKITLMGSHCVGHDSVSGVTSLVRWAEAANSRVLAPYFRFDSHLLKVPLRSNSQRQKSAFIWLVIRNM